MKKRGRKASRKRSKKKVSKKVKIIISIVAVLIVVSILVITLSDMKCPQDVSISLKNVECKKGRMNFNLKNDGIMNIDGYLVKVFQDSVEIDSQEKYFGVVLAPNFGTLRQDVLFDENLCGESVCEEYMINSVEIIPIIKDGKSFVCLDSKATIKEDCMLEKFYCGDTSCNGDESCLSCEDDCGVCSTGGSSGGGGGSSDGGGSSPVELSTCSGLGGDICTESEVCSGSYIESLDSSRCCDVTCKLAEISCSSLTTCSNYSVSECEDDRCGFINCGVVDGACTQLSCIDSDGGSNYLQQGWITLANGITMGDICTNDAGAGDFGESNYLGEIVCNGNDFSIEVAECNCISGHCEICVDSDGGLNYEEVGYATYHFPNGELRGGGDTCIDSNHLGELYCEGNDFYVKNVDCICLGGRCL